MNCPLQLFNEYYHMRTMENTESNMFTSGADVKNKANSASENTEDHIGRQMVLQNLQSPQHVNITVPWLLRSIFAKQPKLTGHQRMGRQSHIRQFG